MQKKETEKTEIVLNVGDKALTPLNAGGVSRNVMDRVHALVNLIRESKGLMPLDFAHQKTKLARRAEDLCICSYTFPFRALPTTAGCAAFCISCHKQWPADKVKDLKIKSLGGKMRKPRKTLVMAARA